MVLGVCAVWLSVIPLFVGALTRPATLLEVANISVDWQRISSDVTKNIIQKIIVAQHENRPPRPRDTYYHEVRAPKKTRKQWKNIAHSVVDNRSNTNQAMGLSKVQRSPDEPKVNLHYLVDYHSGQPDARDGQWIYSPEDQKPAYIFMHIPKAAGTSFKLDAKEILPVGVGFFHGELCSHTIRKISHAIRPTVNEGEDRLITFVRSPRAHLLSRYHECRGDDSEWNPVFAAGGSPLKDAAFASFEAWLAWFRGGKELQAFGCYNPYNSQSNAFICNVRGVRSKNLSAQRAIRVMQSYFFVGVAELYRESICVFTAKARPEEPLPSWCACAHANAFHLHHETHGIKKDGKFSEEACRYADQLVKEDELLYAAAVDRLHQEMREIYNKRGIRIAC
jgi:hypothetical protein